jgi:hypothetical protein
VELLGHILTCFICIKQHYRKKNQISPNTIVKVLPKHFKIIVMIFLENSHHLLYQTSCPICYEIVIPLGSGHGQHQLQQHMSQPNKSWVRRFILECDFNRMKFSSSTMKDRLTLWILLCRASQLSLDRPEAICNGWILD